MFLLLCNRPISASLTRQGSSRGPCSFVARNTNSLRSLCRLEKLVQLYQRTSTFITYNNLSAKIDACLSGPTDNRSTTGLGLISSGRNNNTLTNLLQERKDSLERNWTGRVNTLYSPRLEALKSVLVGKEDGIGNIHIRSLMKE